MSTPFATSSSLSRFALCAAVAAGVSLASLDADAQRGGGGKPSAGFQGGKPGWSGGGHGGGHGRWQGGGHGGGGHGSWHGGGRHGGWHGGHGHWRGHHHHHGWHGGRYYYPGWALGLGVGVGLTYPWWGWGWNYPYYPYAYPSSYVVYEGAYDAPAGVVIDRAGPPASAPAPAYRWYCPSPQGYHPDVVECAAGWLKVLPSDARQPSAPLPPRSSAPDGDSPRIAPGTMGAAPPPKIAAPRMTRPIQLAGAEASPQRLAHGTTD